MDNPMKGYESFTVEKLMKHNAELVLERDRYRNELACVKKLGVAEMDRDHHTLYCSVCSKELGTVHDGAMEFGFCPWCGAMLEDVVEI